MKITATLEQFNNGNTLIIVTSNQGMRAYYTHNGLIDLVISFRIFKPAYSDKEGFYKSPSQGYANGIRSGSVLRPVERAIRLDFKREFKDKLDKVAKKNHIKKVVVFTPKRNQTETLGLISKDLQQKIIAIIPGNYVETTPFELIKKITKATKKTKIIPTKESAQKLLDKA